jgi:hypothetical protein
MTPSLFLLLGGCIATVDINQDADGDGLLDPAEVVAGSDPTVADTDGDGYLDGDEVRQNTSPVDANDKPYLMGWPIDSCRQDISGNGTKEGEVAGDFALLDQFGETVHLYDFCNQVVYLVFAAFW